jgi:histidinol-phosphate phosphatase family protein
LKQAVILAGGQSTRLRDRLAGRPKPLVDIDGIPLLGRQLALLQKCGVADVAVLVNYAAEQIREYCAANAPRGMQLRCIDEGTPRGTAGAVLASLDDLGERFAVLYGDTLLNVDLGRFWDFHAACGADATLFLHPNEHPEDSDIAEIDDNGWIRAFHASPHPKDRYLPNLVNAALYIVERSALEPWRGFEAPSDFAKQLFPAMLNAGQRLRGYVSFEYVYDVGTPARLDTAIAHLRSGRVARASLAKRQKAVFTDRDGTLNVKLDYVRTPGDLKLIEGVAPAVRRLNEAELRVVVVTNQPVLARGECTLEGLQQIHAKLETELGRSGAFVDRILFCPHHPERGFPGEVAALKVECACRKPGTALIEIATRELNIDLAQSWLIGDSSADVLTAARANVRSILVGTGSGGRDGSFKITPDFVADDFPAAVGFILDDYPKLTAVIAPVLDRIRPGDVVLIGGLARAGKSTVAQVVRAELRARGHDTAVVALDRWIRPVDERGDGILRRFDLDLAVNTLAPWFAERRPVRLLLPIYDRLTRRRLDEHDELELAADAVLVIEGVPAFAVPVPPPRRVHRIYVGAAEHARHDRVIADLIHRGSNQTEAEAIYLSRERDEAPTISALRSDDDHVINLDEILGCAGREHSHDH